MEDPQNSELVCPNCGRPRPSYIVRSYGAMLRAAAENRCWLSDGACRDHVSKPHVTVAGESHLEDKVKSALRRYVAQAQYKRAMLGPDRSLAVAG